MKNEIKVSATIEADVKKVWDYYTNPKHIVNWNFADPSWHCPNATNDLKVGGEYKARMEAIDGSFGFDFEAIYTKVTEGKEFTYEFGGRTANVKFNKLNNQTEIIVVFEPESENPVEMQKEGWQAILDNFKTYTEKT
ncbi:SRPBCC domain-containing protein [Polaribacter cellanae]|uniref:SRPBCC domain-containing protein n=1 Tax=Polaribacter cellanae TaxID=2818493 RepID=A0A975CQR4_9FLAO|nr:SRPBCC domain-containing protein [Polaribacter cellanae]QTE23124.1 SRPBCC domain-containing protein [Polaribacter cellanae]